MTRPKAAPRFNRQEFAKRRRELMALLEPGSIAILPSAQVMDRNNDVTFPFRQDSDFIYLTGFMEPESVFVLVPGREHGEAILFCRERDPDQERWHGKITGPERAMQLYGIDDAFPISDIDDILPGLIEGKNKLYYAMGANPEFDARVIGWVKGISGNKQSGTRPPGEFVQLGQYLHELRLFKSAQEIEVMKHGAEITGRAHRRLMTSVTPGMQEYQLEAEFQHELTMSGARSQAYPAIVGGGENACILHYISNDETLRAGDLVLVDAGAEYEYYASDVTRTFPVSGKFTKAQKAVYNVVLNAQLAAIEAVKPGNHWNQPHEAAVHELTRGLVELGLLEGDVDELVACEAYRKFYMHRTGHWLGLDVHDVGEYRIDDTWRVFEPGMVTTIEPGLYISEELEDVPSKYRGIGIRIEDDVLVTATGNEVITAGIPKTVEEIEALMAGESL
ncbi:MAG: Xaa-Pro aminopeptidase [Pseudomonadales bacterium]|nr:Xaa-Pro aminopeptidase [Pseudomonadales bacterium]